ncbi:hypothetical protein ADUPG1_007218 [Aduncisulcus paluster]|uniref:Uncharacterized protein n=1 Tax=Aduncisulcus paluster TaxID=2918883 RepID=A0ABQ5KL60_9EUKA|nr:hypothetical protein ADUPG1_007218 [Aduncisulcus paluster]
MEPIPADILSTNSEIPDQFVDQNGVSFDHKLYQRDSLLLTSVNELFGDSLASISTSFSTVSNFASYTKIIGAGGVELVYPGVYNAQCNDGSAITVENRVDRSPLSNRVILESNANSLRRGVVILLDTTIDSYLLDVLRYCVGGNIYSQKTQQSDIFSSSMDDVSSSSIVLTYHTLLLSVLSSMLNFIDSLASDTYLAVVSTDGLWRGDLSPQSALMIKECYGDYTSETMTGGLTRMTTSAKEALIGNLSKYIASISSFEDHVVPSRISFADAEDSPMFAATSLGIRILRAAVDPSIDLSTIVAEKISTLGQMSESERDLLTTAGRPLSRGSPLSLVTFSIGSTPPPYYMIWLRKQLNSIPGAPILPIYVYSETHSLIHDAYGSFEVVPSSSFLSVSSSFSTSSSSITLDKSFSEILSSINTKLIHSISKIDAFLEQIELIHGVVLRVSLSDAHEEMLNLRCAAGQSDEWLTLLSESEDFCVDVESCSCYVDAYSKLFMDTETITAVSSSLTETLSYFSLQAYLSVVCDLDVKDSLYPSVEQCMGDSSHLVDLIPFTLASSTDDFLGRSTISLSKPLIDSQHQIIGYVVTSIDSQALENFLYNDNDFYALAEIDSRYANFDLTRRYSYPILFDIHGNLLAHSALSSTGSDSTTTDIDILEPLFSSIDGSETFSDLVIEKCLHSHIRDGTATGVVLRQMTFAKEFTSLLEVEFHWTTSDSGFILVFGIGSQDAITVTDPEVTEPCDSNYPANYSEDYIATGAQYDPLETRDLCYYPILLGHTSLLSDSDLALLGYTIMSDEYTLLAGKRVYDGTVLIPDDSGWNIQFGLADESDITVDVVQDVSAYFNGDPSSQVWATNEQLMSVRTMSSCSYYWRYDLSKTDIRKTVLYLSGMIDVFSHDLLAYMIQPIGYSLNLEERDYMQQLVGFGKYKYHFSPTFLIAPDLIPSFALVLPLQVSMSEDANVASNEISSVTRFGGVSFLLTDLAHEALSEGICNDSGYSCYIVGAFGSIMFATDTTQFEIVVSTIEDGEKMNITELCPGIASVLINDLEVLKFVDVYTPFSGIVSQLVFDDDKFVDSVAISVSGETLVQYYAAGDVPSECSSNASFLIFRIQETSAYVIVAYNYNDDVCDTIESTASSTTLNTSEDGYYTWCGVQSMYEVSHEWSGISEENYYDISSFIFSESQASSNINSSVFEIIDSYGSYVVLATCVVFSIISVLLYILF